MASSLIGPVVGSVVGGLFSNNSANTAANAAQAGTDAATRAQMDMFNRQVELTAPQRNAGNAAMNRMGHLLGLTRTGFSNQRQPQAYPQPAQQQQPSPHMRGQMEPEQMGGGAEYWSAMGSNQSNAQRQNGMMTDGNIQNYIQGQYGNETPSWEQPQEGYGTDSEYGSLMRDFGMSDFEREPGYQFRQDEGNKALMRRASASGGIYSGAAMKEAMRFNQGIASDEYGRAFDRFQVNRGNKLNPLLSLAGMGQQGVSSIGQAGQSMANQVGGYALGNANMQGAAAITRGNALNSAFQNAWQGMNRNNGTAGAFNWTNKTNYDD